MPTAQRDEGVDRLEAFIALLDAAHDRLEEGAERLESAAEALEEHEDDLEDVVRAITQGGQGAMAFAMMVTTAVAGVTEESESGEDPIVNYVTRLEEATTALHDYVRDVVIGEDAAQAQEVEKEELDRLATGLERLQEMTSELKDELRVLQERELDITREKEKALKAATCSKTPMMVLAVALTIVAIVVSVFTLGATLELFTVVAVVILACVAAVVSAMVTIVEHLPELLRAMGFVESAEDLKEWMDEDWFKTACMVLMIIAAIVSMIPMLGPALSAAVVIVALAVPLTIAMCVVENVARLLSALNPFD